jgi:hypothetical protein
MEEIIGKSGKIKMIYNYLSNDNKLFRVNEIFNCEKTIRINATSGCNCSGKVNTYYVVNGTKIPTTRAIKI